MGRIPENQGGSPNNRERRIDGICSDVLYEAILRFQRRHFPNRVDGHIDPHGQTLALINRLAANAAVHTPVVRVLAATPITDGPTMLPPTPSVINSNDETQRRRIEWSNFVNETLSELRGNPNIAAVTRHLQSLEQAAGSNVPSIPNVVVFGEATVTNGGDGVHDARVLERGSRVGTHGNGNVVLLFPPQEGHSGGSSMLLGPHTLLVILGRHSNPQVRAATAADTTLMNGNLRSHLGALAGRPNR